MDSHLNIPTVDISRVRKYSLADLDTIDFSTSDDLAIVVENLRNIISLELNIENFWNEENEQLLWQFVIDPESLILSCYFSDDKLFVTCDVPRVNVTELFWIIKAFPEKLYSSDYNTKLLFGTVKAPIFESLYSLFSHLYAPVFFKSQDWSKCIQTDYQNSLTEFLSELFHMNNELFGKVIFYVPEQVLHKDIITILDNKELLNQVEKAVMQWIWIFVTVLMKRNSDTAENRGPLEEIEFWELKHSDLKNILSQLDRDDVKLCIEALKSANLASYYKFIELKDNLLVEFNIAVSNIKFLSLLKDTCVLLRESAMTDIPSILPKLLDLTRIIWNNSSYYKDTIMSNLLGKVNNFVITVISCHVPLEEIFLSVHVTDLKNKLINVISCCKSWLEIFDYSEKVHKKFAPSTWSVEPISPLVNLFIHRCEEFIEICNYKEDFHCDAVLERYAQGLKCFEIVEHFQKIELKFQTLLADLSQSTPVALNVNKAEWYDYFKKFKVDISELYVAVSKLMSNKFENLNSIEEGIQILSLFQKFFEKQVVRHELRRCVKYLYELFFKEVNSVKKQLIDLDESSDLLYPSFGGRAFYASILPQRIKQLYKIINDSKSIWPLEYNEEVEEFYEQALGSIEEYKHTLFSQWCKTIPKEPYAWLSDLIIIKKENSEFFYINLNKDVLNTIYELFYWNKARVEIPQSIIHLHQKSDIFLKRIFRMVECVRSYNRIVSSLSSDEKMYFRNVLLSLEEDVKPAIIGLNWSAPQSKAIEALKLFTNRVKLVS
nr:dynein-1-beta heavy chain, flagellar inner arm I1 complex [Parasteatoda tepidariorum]